MCISCELIESRLFYVLLLLVQSTTQFDTLTCGVRKGCVLNPPGCDPSSNCISAFSYQVDGDSLLMEVSGAATNGPKSYVAVGFSTDTFMENAAVTACSLLPDQPLQGRLSFNIGLTNKPVVADENLLNDTLKTLSAIYANERLSCVLRQKIIPPNGLTKTQVWPLNRAYYILLALGPTRSTGNAIHSIEQGPFYPYVSPSMENLQAYQTGNRATTMQQRSSMQTSPTDGVNVNNANKLKKVHGILMCIAWMVFFSNAMIFARYYRKHWPNTKPCGLAMWFQLHRLLNMIGIGLTIASFACIFSSKGWQWSGPRAYQPAELNETWGSIHSMLGLLACVAAWMQPLNVVFRCEHQSSLRIIFNILHRFCGFSAWLMAAASTMIAVRWFSGRFTSPHAALGLFVTYVVVFGVTFIFSEVLYIRIWWQRKNVVVSSDVEMYPIDEKDSNVILSADEEKRNRLQLVISGVFFVVSSGTCVAICCLMGMVDE